MKRLTIVLSETDAYYPERHFIEGRVLIETDNGSMYFEDDKDIQIFNEKTKCWTDRKDFSFAFINASKRTYI